MITTYSVDGLRIDTVPEVKLNKILHFNLLCKQGSDLVLDSLYSFGWSL